MLGFDDVFVPVGDLAEAVAFYRDVLGFPIAKQFDAMSMALFRVGDETPGLGIGISGTPGSGATELSAKGVRPLRPPFEIPTGWAFEIRDPWGNVIGFTDYLAMPDLGGAANG